MPYEYIEDGVTADVTFVATGRDLGELFAAAADATTNVMLHDLAALRPVVPQHVSVEAESLDLLLKRFLDEIIFLKDTDGLLLRSTSATVEARDDHYRLSADLVGEPIDRARHELLADAKAVTLCGLAVTRTDTGWRAQVTLDV